MMGPEYSGNFVMKRYGMFVIDMNESIVCTSSKYGSLDISCFAAWFIDEVLF